MNNEDTIVVFGDNSTSASINFKEKITIQTGADGKKDVQIMMPSRYWSNFWRTPEIPLNKFALISP